MSQEIIKKKVKSYSLKPFSFDYVEAITNDFVIKGGGFYFLGKHLFTIAHCNSLWVDKEGIPYKFKKDGDIWFIRKFAFSFK